MSLLVNLTTRNYRCLADLSLDLRPINVFFGPNGSGKSTILDALWFFRECVVNGVESASAQRGQGIGLLWDRAASGEPLEIGLSTKSVAYHLSVRLTGGRIELCPGERLQSFSPVLDLIQRPVGAREATFYRAETKTTSTVTLRAPEKLSLGLYLDLEQTDQRSAELDRVLRLGQFYHTRSLDSNWLRYRGSETGHDMRLDVRGRNAWSVLRNLHDRRSVDERYDTIMGYMTESFPTFRGLSFEQTGPTSVYANFVHAGRANPEVAAAVSDGYLQMLLLLTVLFSEAKEPGILLFDEPEHSLHPWALNVLARAVQKAVRWGKQVLIATHSPVLLSDFDQSDIFATSLQDGRTEVKPLTDLDDARDLLPDYSPGSLYMGEVIGGQRDYMAIPTGK